MSRTDSQTEAILTTAVSTNTTNIGTNTTNIGTNTTNIGTNTTNIGTNTTNIGTNTTDIGTLQTDVTNLENGRFEQGGNSFAATATLGTNDANDLVIETNNTSRFTLDQVGRITANTASYETIVDGPQVLANKKYVDDGVAGATLSGLTDTTIASAAIGNQLTFSAGDWKNITSNSGVIKVNTFDTDMSSNNQLVFTSLTTEVDIEYRISGETTTTLDISGFPTSSPPQNVNGGTFTNPTDFYTIGAGAGDDRWIQNPVEGQVVIYRFEGTYSSKPSGNSGRIQIRQYNPLSSFSIEQSVPLSAGITTDGFVVNLISFSDSANIPSGYKFGISSTTSLDITLDSVSRIDLHYSTRT